MVQHEPKEQSPRSGAAYQLLQEEERTGEAHLPSVPSVLKPWSCAWKLYNETTVPRLLGHTSAATLVAPCVSGRGIQDISIGRRHSWWLLHVSPGDLALGWP